MNKEVRDVRKVYLVQAGALTHSLSPQPDCSVGQPKLFYPQKYNHLSIKTSNNRRSTPCSPTSILSICICFEECLSVLPTVSKSCIHFPCTMAIVTHTDSIFVVHNVCVLWGEVTQVSDQGLALPTQSQTVFTGEEPLNWS